ncbi:MAG TPA: hypothetical protein VFY12_04220 [Arenimonas sp.]|nr:hypothetical protein [Arenimonas sp.]
MKLQIQNTNLRLRIDERELADLLAGGTLALALHAQRKPLLDVQVQLAPSLGLASESSHWRLQLPDAELRAYAQTLPRRDALSLALADDLRLDFEVDVRDSIRERGAKRRS